MHWQIRDAEARGDGCSGYDADEDRPEPCWCYVSGGRGLSDGDTLNLDERSRLAICCNMYSVSRINLLCCTVTLTYYARL